MPLKELGHTLRLVGREVVEDEVNLLIGLATVDDLIKKLDEVLAGVTRGGIDALSTDKVTPRQSTNYACRSIQFGDCSYNTPL